MTTHQWTLWDLFTPRSKQRAKKRHAKRRPPPQPAPTRSKRQPTKAQQRYEEVTRAMLAQHGVRVRKWRTSMSGVAWQVTYHDGSVAKLLESPRPKGPMSMAIFLHEIGHHAIGFGTYKPRCLEEYHAWKFALDTMRELGLNVTDRVEQRMRDSLQYAVEKALRRGMKRVPRELVPYLPKGAQIHPDPAPNP